MGEGMPYGNTYDKGQLIITFNVVFPPEHSLNENVLNQLRTLLPAPKDISIPQDAEDVNMVEFVRESERRRDRRGEAYDSEPRQTEARCATN